MKMWMVVMIVGVLVQMTSAFGGTQPGAAVPYDMGARAGELQQPAILQKVGIDQNLGTQVPLDLIFHDEDNRQVRLGNYFQRRPVVLVLVYYECPMLCTMVLNDLLRSIRSMSETVGKDFDIVTVSFDPRDTPHVASKKKKNYLAQYNRPGAESGWHFLTGDQASIDALTRVAGFHYTWDAKNNVFAHASGIMVATPSGKLSRYFFGIDYAPKDLRLALAEASDNKTGSPTTAVLLYCFCYDPATGKYGLAISRILKVGGIATVLILGSFIIFSLLRERRTHAVADVGVGAVPKKEEPNAT
jgi:protein SCO1/2